jgi:hypothetical protein
VIGCTPGETSALFLSVLEPADELGAAVPVLLVAFAAEANDDRPVAGSEGSST